MSNSLRPHELQHTRPPCPSPILRVYSNSYPSSWWCNPAISSSVIPFSSCPQSLPASGSFPTSQLFASGGQSIGASASVLPLNSQGWFPLQLTILICYPPTQLSDLCIYASMCLIYYLSAYLSIYLVGKLITVYTSIMYLVYSCIHLAIMYLSSTNIIIYHP